MSPFPPWNEKRDGPQQPPAHDTAEAVEAMCDALRNMPLVQQRQEVRAMLRRLHAAKVEAERERDEARQNLLHEANVTRAALATARADALREAAAVCGLVDTHEMRDEASADVAINRASALILALIPQPTTTGET